MLPIGQKTKWGKIAMIRTIEGERYYFMIDKSGCVAMMPSDVVEPKIIPSKGER